MWETRATHLGGTFPTPQLIREPVPLTSVENSCDSVQCASCLHYQLVSWAADALLAFGRLPARELSSVIVTSQRPAGPALVALRWPGHGLRPGFTKGHQKWGLCAPQGPGDEGRALAELPRNQGCQGPLPPAERSQSQATGSSCPSFLPLQLYYSTTGKASFFEPLLQAPPEPLLGVPAAERGPG